MFVVSENETERASQYYRSTLNEESAEIWLHRGFVRQERRKDHCRSSNNCSNTSDTNHKNQHDPPQISAVLIVGYLHLKWGLRRKDQRTKHEQKKYHSTLINTYTQHLQELYSSDPHLKTLPHLVLIPTFNPGVSMDIGLRPLINALTKVVGIENLWSVGFERNQNWQGVPIEKILPIPYVVELETPYAAPHPQNTTTTTIDENTNNMTSSKTLSHVEENRPSWRPSQHQRQSNFLFYSGDVRPHAKLWAGCHRDLLLGPLVNYSSHASHHNRMPEAVVLEDGNLHLDVGLVASNERQQRSWNTSHFGFSLSTRLNQ